MPARTISVLNQGSDHDSDSSNPQSIQINPIMTTSRNQWKGLTKPYPSTALDLAIEDKDLNNSSFNANNVYEWNIHGKSEYNIMHMLQHMTMICTAYQTTHESSEEAIANIIVSGFTGKLKGWWDHYLTEAQKLGIFSVVKIDDNGEPIFNEAPTINVLTKEQDLLFEAINSIPDPEEKRNFLNKLKQTLEKQPRNSVVTNKYDLNLSSRKKPHSEPNLEHNEVDWSDFLGLINRLTIQKFFINIKIIFEDFVLETIALFDTGADSNCILEGLIPTKYFEKTSEKLSTANRSKLQIRYKLSKATIENQGQQIPSKSPWSCAAFYVNKQAELERGTPRLVINYKPLNQSLQWIRYPIPNKKGLLNRLHSAKIFSKFDMKSGYWQIQIQEKESKDHTTSVKHVKQLVKNLPCLSVPIPQAFKIVETDAFDLGYGGILKQKKYQKNRSNPPLKIKLQPNPDLKKPNHITFPRINFRNEMSNISSPVGFSNGGTSLVQLKKSFQPQQTKDLISSNPCMTIKIHGSQ
uniref:Polyprotein n=1 Tax=Cajanus cajan TaxID=3821 RepID=A0A151UHT0_CAJCA